MTNNIKLASKQLSKPKNYFLSFFFFHSWRADKVTKRSYPQEQCQGSLPQLPPRGHRVHQDGMSGQHRRPFTPHQGDHRHPHYYHSDQGWSPELAHPPPNAVPTPRLRRLQHLWGMINWSYFWSISLHKSALTITPKARSDVYQLSALVFCLTCKWMAIAHSKGPTRIHWALCYNMWKEKCNLQACHYEEMWHIWTRLNRS